MGELIGYARCSTVLQDLTAQRQALVALSVPDDRIYLDKSLTGTSRARPGLDQALAAVRTGDTLVVPKLDRLAAPSPTPATSATPSSPAASGSPSAAVSMTPLTPSARCSSTSWPPISPAVRWPAGLGRAIVRSLVRRRPGDGH
jgi:hypothetical protein